MRREAVVGVIKSYCLVNSSDKATTDLLLAVGAEILGISKDEMRESVARLDEK